MEWSPQKPFLPFILVGLSVALGPALGGYFLSKGIVQSRTADRFVTVKGLVEKIVKSDTGYIMLNLTQSNNDQQIAYKNLSVALEIVKDELKKIGFKEGEITLYPITVTDVFSNNYSNISEVKARYTISTSVYITSSNVDLIAKAPQQLGKLAEKGVIFSNVTVQYRFSKFNEMRPELINEAYTNAQKMAEQFAKSSGSRVGSIRRANQGMIQITSPFTSEGENYYGSDSDSIEKKIRVVATVDFFLND